MERIYRLLKDTVAGAQTALAQCVRWTREKALVCGHLLAANPPDLRLVPVRISHPRRERGFTLIELIVTLLVGAILLGVGLPSLQKYVQANRINSELGELTTAFNVARSEAARMAAIVRVCARNGDACSNNAADWRNGWIAFRDKDGDGVIDADEEILHDHVQPYPAVVVQLADNTAEFTYKPAGDVGATKLFYVCDDRVGTYGRRVEIASSGRVSVDQTKQDVSQASVSAQKCI